MTRRLNKEKLLITKSYVGRLNHHCDGITSESKAKTNGHAMDSSYGQCATRHISFVIFKSGRIFQVAFAPNITHMKQ